MQTLLYEQCNDSFVGNRGHYHRLFGAKQKGVAGRFQVRNWHGLSVIDTKNSQEQKSSLEVSPSVEHSDHIFLVKQALDEVKIIHNGHNSTMTQGDFILLDPSKPAKFISPCERSYFISISLSKIDVLNSNFSDIEIGKLLKADNPKARALNTVFPENNDTANNDSVDQNFLNELTQLAFAANKADENNCDISAQTKRHEKTLKILNQHIKDPNFNLYALQKAVKLSRRQLQRDFKAHGASFTTELINRRLSLVEDQLRRAIFKGKIPNISQIAFDCGFGDISNFNRVFKKHYGTSPSAYITVTKNQAQ